MINKKKTSGLMSFKFLLALPVVTLMLTWNAQHVFSQEKISVTVVTKEISEDEEESPMSVAMTPVSPEREKASTENTGAKSEDEKPFTSVEQMPQFPGGDKAMMEYVGTNVKYPELAVKDGVQGRVVVRFIVSKTGEVKDVVIVRSLGAECDAEAIRVIKSMPTWIPGKQNNKEVSVYYTLPVIFRLP